MVSFRNVRIAEKDDSHRFSIIFPFLSGEKESLIEVIYSVETFPPHQQKNCLILHLALPRELSFPSSQKTRDRVPGLISNAL